MIAFTFGLGAFAQGKMDDKMKMDSKEQQMDMKKDHIMMMDGKMVMQLKGKEMNMEKDMTLSNGTMVMMDGMIKSKDGITMMMKEGDAIGMDGKMGKMNAEKMKMGKMKMKMKCC